MTGQDLLGTEKVEAAGCARLDSVMMTATKTVSEERDTGETRNSDFTERKRAARSPDASSSDTLVMLF